jgi:hypothetical protein
MEEKNKAKCEHCKYYREHYGKDMRKQHQCRRYPPVPIMIPVAQKGLIQGQTFFNCQMVFPNVELDGWCGEFSMKPTPHPTPPPTHPTPPPTPPPTRMIQAF